MERSHGGDANGLALVGRRIGMHGSTVQAHGDGPGSGSGSEFTVPLPPAASANEGSAPLAETGDAAVASQHRRILVADDNQDSAISMAMLFELMGHEVRTARDGQQAVEVARTFRPELVLLDIGMPRLSGLEACRRIRAEPWSKSAVMVALTGRGQADDRLRSLEAGFDHHLVKPVDMAVLEAMLGSLKPAPCGVPDGA